MLVFCAVFAATAIAADPTVTVTALQVAPAVTVYGEPTALNVHVFIPLDNSPAHGAVKFYDGDALLATAELDPNGRTSIGEREFALGEHNVTAVFVPADETEEAASQSAAVGHDVEQAGSQIIIVLNPVDTIGRTTITARVLAVSPSLGTPTGSITLYLDDVKLGDADLRAGVASIATRKLHVGNRTVSVHYSGDTNYVDCDSIETELDIKPEAFDTSIEPSSAKMAPGDTSHFTLTLTPTFERDSVVQFVCGNLPVNGRCAFEPTNLTLAADPQTVDVTVTIDEDLTPTLGLAIAIGAAAGGRKRRKLLAGTALFACLACGDARPLRGDPVRVTAVSENVSKSADLTLEIR